MSYTILSTTVITIILALFILLTIGKTKGRIFGITLIGAVIWGLSLNLIYNEQDLSVILNFLNLNPLYLIRIAFLGAIITVTGLVIFERSYLRNKSWNYLIYWIFIFILGYIFIFTPLIVKDVMIMDLNKYKFDYGYLYLVYGLSYLSLIHI